MYGCQLVLVNCCMRFSKVIFITLVASCLHYITFAQQAQYASVYTGYNAQIAGINGNRLHVWSASAAHPGRSARHITLTLQVFSTDMRFISEVKFDLGIISSWYINFHHEKEFYYANIVSLSATNKRRMLKVQPAGDYEDVSNMVFPGNNIAYTDEQNRFVTLVRTSHHIFSVDIDNAKLTSSDTIQFLPGDTIAAGENYQRIHIKKTDIITRQSTQCVLASAGKRFYRPMITVTDSVVLFAAVSDPITEAKSKQSSFLLVAMLDTNIEQTSCKKMIVLPSRFIKENLYRPINLFKIGKSVVLLSKGLYNKETVRYYTVNSNGITVPAFRIWNNYITSSLKITLLNEEGLGLKDTILTSNGGNKQLLLDDMFTIASANGVDLFVGKKYSASKHGITHFSINTEGAIKEEEMMVELRYNYAMPSARPLLPGVLLVPFGHNWKRGLMKLEYEPVQ